MSVSGGVHGAVTSRTEQVDREAAVVFFLTGLSSQLFAWFHHGGTGVQAAPERLRLNPGRPLKPHYSSVSLRSLQQQPWWEL